MDRLTNLVLLKGDKVTRVLLANNSTCPEALTDALCSRSGDSSGPALNIRDQEKQGPKTSQLVHSIKAIAHRGNSGWPYWGNSEGHRASVLAKRCFSTIESSAAKGGSQLNLVALTKLMQENPNTTFERFTPFYANMDRL